MHVWVEGGEFGVWHTEYKLSVGHENKDNQKAIKNDPEGEKIVLKEREAEREREKGERQNCGPEMWGLCLLISIC